MGKILIDVTRWQCRITEIRYLGCRKLKKLGSELPEKPLSDVLAMSDVNACIVVRIVQCKMCDSHTA